MPRVNVNLRAPIYEALQTEVSQSGNTQAKVINDALDLYLRIRGRKEPDHRLVLVDENGQPYVEFLILP